MKASWRSSLHNSPPRQGFAVVVCVCICVVGGELVVGASDLHVSDNNINKLTEHSFRDN
jgi:hypothetical protein